jgi:glycosyltransferase involved in cell wall biosynthesis
VRLAWFTPWPPQPSGIAGRSVEVTNLLARRGWGIDVVVDDRRVPGLERLPDTAVPPGAVRVQSAHDFVWRHSRGQYDLVVYQVGNSRHHDFMWPYLFRWPGLVVLHDARLHHARARKLLTPRGQDAYRTEFAFDHPEAPIEVAELAIAGFDGRYYSMWPMTRAVVEGSRAVAVHSRGLVDDLQAAHPHRSIGYLPLGMGRRTDVSPAERDRTRRRYGVDDHAVVFGVFGGLSADKRIPEILRAFAVVRQRHRHVRLWLAGAADSATNPIQLAEGNGVRDAVTYLGTLDDEAFDEAIAASDVCLNLRWPTALETSGPWLQALSMARPTVIVELAHQAHVPALDPRDWRPRNPADPRQPVTVAIDILDEHHSLVLAMDRLATDAGARTRLGTDARHYWLKEHTPDLMADGYQRIIEPLIQQPVPAVSLPDTVRPDVWRATREHLAQFGISQCELR